MKNLKLTMRSGSLLLGAALLTLFACEAVGEPAGTAFTYQGRLNDGGIPAEGAYEMTFTLYDSASNGVPVSDVLTNSAIPVQNGLFNVGLDFGSAVFNGDARWLEIGVRSNGAAVAFTPLSPRQALTPTPYALQAGSAASATSVLATNITGTIPDSQLSTNIARLDGSATFSGTITATQFTGSGAGLTNLSDVVHPADFSAPSWTYDKTYTYRANEMPWDFARDGFILMTAYPYSMEFTNALQITNGYVTIYPKEEPASPSGYTNWPPFYLAFTNQKPIQVIEADMVVTTNGATTANTGYARQLVLLLGTKSFIGTGGTNYTLSGVQSVHVAFRPTSPGNGHITAICFTNSLQTYTNEVIQGRAGALSITAPYNFVVGDVVKCSIGWANDDTLLIQMGAIVVPWHLDRFRSMSANTHYGWLESYDQFQTNFGSTMAFKGLRYSVNRQRYLAPGVEVRYTNSVGVTGGMSLTLDDIHNAKWQFNNPVEMASFVRPTWNGVGLATMDDIGNTNAYQMAAEAISGGLTTSIEVPTPGGGTNTLYFTNGVLRSVQ